MRGNEGVRADRGQKGVSGMFECDVHPACGAEAHFLCTFHADDVTTAREGRGEFVVLLGVIVI